MILSKLCTILSHSLMFMKQGLHDYKFKGHIQYKLITTTY